MSLFSSVEGFTFPGINDEVNLQHDIYALPVELIRHIMKYQTTVLDTLKKMVFRYKARCYHDPDDGIDESGESITSDISFYLLPVRKGVLDNSIFDISEEDYLEYEQLFVGEEKYMISHYQRSMAAIWYIYRQIDPYQTNMDVKNIVIKHLTVICNEVLSTGNRSMVFQHDQGLAVRTHQDYVWYYTEQYVTSLVNNTSDEGDEDGDIDPLGVTLDSLCSQINFPNIKEALKCLGHFYSVNRPCCDSY